MDNIREACLTISYANGGINRFRSEKEVVKKFADFCESRPYENELKAVDAWLGTLSLDQLETVCDGEQSEAAVILKTAPAFTETFLNEWFEVC